jgi:CBS domain-containing protein
MVMQTKYVKDIMLPLDEYTVVPEDTTVYQAFLMLKKAQITLPANRHPHRAVLVVNDKNKIVGKLGHRGFLLALEPKYNEMGNVDMISKSGLSKDYVNSLMTNFGLWQSDMEDIRRRTKKIKLKEVMRPVTEHIDLNAPVHEAIHKLVLTQTLSILVTEDDKVVGILRLADLFDEVSRTILEDE